MESSERKIHNLVDITTSFGRCIEFNYNHHYWAKAEMSRLNRVRTGHCYPELIQSEKGKAIAVCKGIIWQSVYKSIEKKFNETVGSGLADGMTIVFQFRPIFSNIRGLLLIITDIDIDSVLGDFSRTRIDTINSLKSQRLFALNKNRTIARLNCRIAVISVETGKGYADFVTSISKSKFGKLFTIKLFPAALVGNQASVQIANQLANITLQQQNFDSIVIIRGGGGEASLQCFNDFTLAKAVACSQLPVLTGIGHATNSTAVEEVAFKSFATPSELANYLVANIQQSYDELTSLVKSISRHFYSVLERQTRNLSTSQEKFKVLLYNYLRASNYKISTFVNKIHSSLQYKILNHNRYKLNIKMQSILSHAKGIISTRANRLTMIERLITTPKRFNGDVYMGANKITSVKQLSTGSIIEIKLSDGIVIAEVREMI